MDSKERKIEQSKRIKHTIWAHGDDSWNVIVRTPNLRLEPTHVRVISCATLRKMWRCEVCCSQSTYLVWILLSKLILSNNQSNETLCVLDTCLIAGFFPWLSFLITASLCSKMYNWDSPWQECAFEVTYSSVTNSSISVSYFGLVLDGMREQSPVSNLFPDAGSMGVFVLFDERTTSIIHIP